MLNEYKYALDKSSKKFYGPNCSKKRFVRYIDTETNQYMPVEFGRCDREIKCAYHKKPGKISNLEIIKPKPYKENTSFVNKNIFIQSLQIKKDIQQLSENNNFIKYLISIFGEEKTSELISLYYIGTSKHWQGATVFYQIDFRKRIRAGKIILYDAKSGKRIKEPISYVAWLHSAMKLKDYNLKQCLFGEHLILKGNKPIAIVESEKTAIIASAYFPQYTWLATGGIQNFNNRILQALNSYKVVLFPDAGAYNTWKLRS